MKTMRTKKNNPYVKKNKRPNIFAILILLGGGYYSYLRSQGKPIPYKSEILKLVKNFKLPSDLSEKETIKSSKKVSNKKILLKTPKPINIDERFLWKYNQKNNARSIALVTSRNKFNKEDISLGFRCDFKSKKKALFLFGKFFNKEISNGQVSTTLDYDNGEKKLKEKLKIVLNGKGLAFKNFDQIKNIQQYSRLKMEILSSSKKKKLFIFELYGSSKSINKVFSDCN